MDPCRVCARNVRSAASLSASGGRIWPWMSIVKVQDTISCEPRGPHSSGSKGKGRERRRIHGHLHEGRARRPRRQRSGSCSLTCDRAGVPAGDYGRLSCRAPGDLANLLPARPRMAHDLPGHVRRRLSAPGMTAVTNARSARNPDHGVNLAEPRTAPRRPRSLHWRWLGRPAEHGRSTALLPARGETGWYPILIQAEAFGLR
jgi:hypothetical protein